MACPDQRFICRFVFRLLYTGTLPVLLQQPDSIATPCFPIQPRLASAPITGLPWNCFRGSLGCNLAPPPGAAAQYAENCSMLCHCVATTAAAHTQQAVDSVICARHEYVNCWSLNWCTCRDGHHDIEKKKPKKGNSSHPVFQKVSNNGGIIV